MVGNGRKDLRQDFPLYHNSLIRSETFSVERLAEHAASLALSHRVLERSPRTRLLEKRLRENNATLRSIYRKIGKAIGESSELPPAAEWLVDNYFVIEEQIRDIRNDLPPKYYLQLPKLAEGYLKAYPRVYGIAWAYIAHTDSFFNADLLEGFIRSYQAKQPLKIGELWAVAITLRIALVENLRRAATLIVEDRQARAEADALADTLVDFIDSNAETLDQQLRRIDRAKLSSPFAVQLIQRLRDQGIKVLPLLNRLDERLHEQGTSAEEIVRTEHQNQGALTVTVRNIITSMRSLSTFDWVEFFERVSLVDEMLRNESSFGSMDLPTRNLYRHAVERLSQRSPHTELEVTAFALQLAREAAPADKSDKGGALSREEDPGYYLIDKGRALLEAKLGYRATMARRLKDTRLGGSFLAYILANVLLTMCIIELGLRGTPETKHTLAALIVISTAIFFPAWEATITLVNRVVISLFTPSILPGMELKEGIPEELRTMVVIPTLLTDETSIRQQAEQLEVHYLSNADGDLRFALLTDWKDAVIERQDGDEERVQVALEAIKSLNDRHPMPDGEPRFFLFHRKRVWNPHERKWMGWERKRGKLHEFNLLLRGGNDTTFQTDAWSNYVCPPAGVRYVVTLDSDTRLPRGAVKRLVGKMAHPLNRARFDDKTQSVLEGYGILQPRVSSSLPHESTNSFFQRVFYSASGIDPYAFAISDVYQDLFEEGSFTGKGIYDVDIFERTITGKLPENTVLSHDLLEGIFARAGLASDVEVVEEFPSRYDVASSRQHRWARGDWQLLPWIFGKYSALVPALGHWKMVDNLRRTLTAPFSLLALVIGWTFPLGSALLWTVLVLTALSMPILLSVIEGIWPRSGAAKSTHVLVIAKDAYRALQQLFLMITFLPHQAWLMMDAISRTMWRMAVSRRHLLEWVTAGEVKVRGQRTIAGFYAYMAGNLIVTAAVAILLCCAKNPMWSIAVPFLGLWSAAPAIAQLASRPGLSQRRQPLNAQEIQAYRLIARSTWRFFERFVTKEDNFLPPDNFQEDPIPVVAHRTSPTNIGLYLLTIVAAKDFGWVSVHEAISRLRSTFDVLAKLERYNGHFYNWYDTVSLQPLLPRYISSVDSGNLAGYFVVISQACKNFCEDPIASPSWLKGVVDVVELMHRSWLKVSPDEESVTARHVGETISALTTMLEMANAQVADLYEIHIVLDKVCSLAEVLQDLTATYCAEIGNKATDADLDVMAWGKDIYSAVTRLKINLDRYSPWLGLIGSSNVGADETFINLRNALCLKRYSLKDIEGLPTFVEPLLAAVLNHDEGSRELIRKVRLSLKAGALAAFDDCRSAQALSTEAFQYFSDMDFSFLLDPARKLLSIGYRVENSTLDGSFYDLLASEARLASIVAIAKGDIPAQNWFRLGRTVTSVDYRPALVSWSGSMFEYLMPALIMSEPEESLIGQTNRMVVKRQIQYGAERGVPWGVSESAYNARDFEFTYQYSSFGVPGLGLKRGLSENIVVAPYATALASMIEPVAALRNLELLESLGGRGIYGWYEAFDFTGKRLPEAKKLAVVHAYMAHHQGMSLIAILNVLHEGIMRDRFHAEPIIQATELLLQELPPRNVAIARPRSEEVEAVEHIREITPPNPRLFSSPHSASPRTQLLSNGEYAIMITSAGAGYSSWRNIAVTRWREDPTRDAWGSFIYLRDAQSGKVWSATYQPVCAEPEAYNVAFFEDHAEFTRRDGDISTTLNVVVSSEDNGEVRRLTIHNNGVQAKDIELTSYAELVLTQPAGDIAHPAFSKLFVQTEFDHKSGALLASRRLRTPDEKPLWAVHLVSVGGEMVGSLQYETDRARFIGRGRTVRNPQAVDGRPLNDTAGVVLDPVFSLRCRVRVQPGATAHVAFWTLTASTRAQALELADKYSSPSAYNRAAARAWTQAQLQYQHLGMTPEEAHLFQRLANYVLYADRGLRPNSEKLRAGAGTQSKLWSMGVSGDLPIVVMRVDVASDLKTLRQMVRAYSYWSFKRLEVDLVILNEQPTTYLEDLQNEIELLVRTSQSMPGTSHEGLKGRIFVFRGDHVAAPSRDLLLAVARAVIVGHRGSLADQLAFQAREEVQSLAPRSRVRLPKSIYPPKPRPKLEFFNGTGGFADEGREYVTILEPGQVTPAPWINVIANPHFGFQVSAEGAGYTWAVNSREYKLTPWSNDPTSDEPGEIIYLRDESTGAIWTPTAAPIRKEGATYVARHGFGYSQFETTCYNIETTLLQFVALDDPIKISRLRLHNLSPETRSLSVSSYVEWALAPSKLPSAPFLIIDKDVDTGAMLATNPWNNEYAGRIAFLQMSGDNIQFTADRREFIGRNGALRNPLALATGQNLSGRTGAGLDPCSVLQTKISIGPGEEIEIVILLGEDASIEAAKALVGRYLVANLEHVRQEATGYWRDLLSRIQVRTPERSMDIMQNGWLLYQTVVCRI